MKKVKYVAEISANHNGSLERSRQLIAAASSAGAGYIKFQTYTPHTMTFDIKHDYFKVSSSNKLWGGRTLFDLYSEAHTPWEWHEELFQQVLDQGMVPFSTPFDKTSVDFLEELSCPIYKIASFELIDTELIEYAASTGKPMVISTGMGTLAEINDAVEAARLGGCKDITLLKTTSSYPASPRDSNLRAMPRLGEIFDVKYGISDHTLGIGAAIASIVLGGEMVEKHLTLNRADGGVDSAFSMEPEEFRQLVDEGNSALDALGRITFGPSRGDEKSLSFRRTLHLGSDVRAGELLQVSHLANIRPGGGLSTKEGAKLIGLRFEKDAKRGTPLTLDLFRPDDISL